MADDPPARAESPASPSASFVYPVRSLLSGIQPQGSTLPVRDAVNPVDEPTASHGQSTRSGGAGKGGATDTSEAASPREGAALERCNSGGPAPRRTQSAAIPAQPNFRHFPAGDTTHPPSSFTSSAQPQPLPASSSFSDARPTTPVYTPGAVGVPVPRDPMPEMPAIPETASHQIDNTHNTHTHLSHVGELSGDTFSAVPPPTPSHDIPFNPSEYGLVHLPPRSDSSDSAKSGSGGVSSQYVTAQSSPGSHHRLGPDPASPSAPKEGPSSTSAPGSAPGSDAVHGSHSHSPPAGAALSEHGSGSLGPSLSARAPDSSAGSSNYPLITMRYTHKEDENGNHLVVGREGQLTRCEDEPICTPGAVQGFGVLIAVHEDPITGNLLVRQVSENCSELLGLSPKYLFSLECFTETLPIAQSDTLWENIQFLREPAPDAEDSPHVFTLTGWGQEGSALPGRPAELGRRLWTCWCAVHRPQTAPPTAANPGGTGGTLILEFELERDTHNPLYPIQSQVAGAPGAGASGASGASSPASAYSGGSDSDVTEGASTDGSVRTLVSRDESHAAVSLDGAASGIMGAGNDNRDPRTTTPGAAVNAPDATLGAFVPEGAEASTPPADEITPPGSLFIPATAIQTTASTSAAEGDATVDHTTDVGTPGVSQGLTGPTDNPTSHPGTDSDSPSAVTIPPSPSLPAHAADPPDPPDLSDLPDEADWAPTAEQILESTTSRSKPIPALERLRQWGKGTAAAAPPPAENLSVRARRAAARARSGGATASPNNVGMMDVFAVMTQINEQLDAVPDLEQFLKVVAGVIKDLSQFHRVMVYQFDELWNGQVVAELVDWNQTHDLFQGLHFPASDIPAQARQLYAINKVRLLYDREQPTARIIVRNKDDLETPLNMTHCYLRAMSPIHIKYLGNMGVRASMSVSIMGFGQLWGLIACHSYGTHRMRVSFPVRQMLRLLCQSISRNIERLSYAQRLQTRKLINTMSSENHPTGQIVSNADELLGLFEADYGILVIGEGAKILGPNIHGQDILVMAEYLRLKQFDTIQVSQSVVKDFPDLELSTGLSVVAGLLYVPLSSGGKDFIAFLRKGQMKEVHWAGRPENKEASGGLEPRKSFKIWSEMVSGRSRSWTDEHMETAGVLALVYGKFIEVWRQKESALQTTRLTNILLSNASHEVRTPLNHIINYLEMALDGPLDDETRENLSMSHAASKSLLFTINDLLDLTRLESGHETSLNEAFDLQAAIEEATRVYKNEASRRNIEFALDVTNSPQMVIGDVKKIKTVVSNLTANSLKYTKDGSITVQCRTFGEPEGLRAPKQTAVEIVVADSGCGIPSDKLESIFREFEQVESSAPRTTSSAGLGLGLAVVARIVEQLGGQLRVDSKVNQGSQFSFLIPLALPGSSQDISSPTGSRHSGGSSHFLNPDRASSRDSVAGSAGSDINSLVEALQSNHMASPKRTASPGDRLELPSPTSQAPTAGKVDVVGSATPMRPIKIEMDGPDVVLRRPPAAFIQPAPPVSTTEPLATLIAAPIVTDSTASSSTISNFPDFPKLRVLVVEDNDINRKVLAKRLSNLGHTVVNTTNGQECLDTVQHDREYDCVLMDIQMPIMNGNDATVGIRKLEQDSPPPSNHPTRHRASQELNGRIPIFAVSASLYERNLDYMIGLGMDGWILKPISFKRLDVILRGITDASQRDRDVYHPGCSWELGGWFTKCSTTSS